jgi:hypothetical protein
MQICSTWFTATYWTQDRSTGPQQTKFRAMDKQENATILRPGCLNCDKDIGHALVSVYLLVLLYPTTAPSVFTL